MVIYTNRRVSRHKGATDGPHLHFPHEDLLRTGGAVFSFGYKDDEVWKLLDNDPRRDLYRHEFLPRLRVFSEQAHVQAVEQLLRVELDAVFGAPLPWSDALLPQYIAALKHWALVDARGGALTDGSGEVERLLAAELARQGRAAAGGGALLFAEEHCAALRAALEGGGGGGEVAVRVRGVPAGHRAAKVVQVLDEALAGRWAYVGDRQLREAPRAALEAVCGAGRVQLLLLDAEEEAAAARGLAAAAVACGVRVVAVSSGRGEDEEDWRMNHLTPEAQEALMDRTLHFQGRAVRLRDLEASWRALREEVDGALLSALVGGGAAVGVALLAPGHAHMDLPRTLEHPTILDSGVLGKLDPLSDHLVLTGFPTSFLQTLYSTLDSQDGGGGIPEINMRRQSEHLSEGNKENDCAVENNKWWSVLPAASEVDDQNAAFRSVCEEKAGLNVHWLHCVAERDGSAAVAWRTTRGATRAVAPFVQLASDACVRAPTCVHASEAVRHAAAWGQRVGLLVGEPGMGKSRFLQRVAAEARALQAPQRWTVLLQALDHRNLLRDFPEPTDLTQKHLLELLAAAAGVASSTSSPSESSQRFLRAALCNSGDIAILIDGVDEICPLNKDKLLRLLQILLETKVQLVWVSSRPEAALALTEALRCPTSALLPFSEAEQKKYLCGHWSSVDPRQRPPAEFEGLASEMVAALHGAAGSGQRSLLDVPLHAQMAAEAYEAQAAQALGAGVSLLPQTGVSLYQLYRSFVERKRDLFERRFGLKDANFENLPFANNFEEIHQNCAMLELVSDGSYSKVDSSAFRDYLDKNRSTLLKEKTGLLWLGEDGRPHFVHYTFIELFAARWLVSQARAGESPPEAAKEMWRSLLVDGAGAGVRRVLEQLLADGLPLHRAVLEEDHAALAAALEAGGDPDERDLLGRSALMQAASLGRADAVGTLLARGADAGRRDALLGWTALRYASACAHLPAAERLLQAGADPLHFDASNIDLADAVHEAARVGCPEIMGIIVKKEEGRCIEIQRNDETPVMIAAKYGHTRTVHILIQSGANVMKKDKFNKQPIHYATSKGNFEISKLLLESKVDPNAGDNENVTPLMMAAGSGDAKTTELLLVYGALVNLKNKDKRGALHYAINHHHITKLLLESKADPNAEDKDYVTPLIKAATSGDVQSTQLLLVHGADINQRDVNNWTALHFATHKCHSQIAKLLLESKADPNAEDKWKVTPLMRAAESSNEQSTQLLLAHGADINHRDVDNWTALHYAAVKCHRSNMKLLLKSKAAPNAVDNENVTPLMRAAGSGDAQSTNLLLEHGADVNQRDKVNWTALHFATYGGHHRITKLLLKNKAEPNLRDNEKYTPLMRAALSGDTQSIELLFQHGADVNQRFEQNRTALHYATLMCRHHITNVLLESKADPDAVDNENVTPLMTAAASGDAQSTDLLLEHGADVNQRDKVNWTALHYAAKNGHHNITNLLLERKADPNAEDNEHVTPLMRAASSGDAESAKCLLEHGAEVNHRDEDKKTTLLYAIATGHHDITELLLKSKADPNAKIEKNVTPLMIAAATGDELSTKLLLKHGADANLRDEENRTALHYSILMSHYHITNLLRERKSSPNEGAEKNVTPVKNGESSDAQTMENSLRCAIL